jgi:hypothetical protein
MPFSPEILALVARTYEKTVRQRSGRLRRTSEPAMFEDAGPESSDRVYNRDDGAISSESGASSNSIRESRIFRDFTYTRARDLQLEEKIQELRENASTKSLWETAPELLWHKAPTENRDTYDADLEKEIAPLFSYESFAAASSSPGATTSMTPAQGDRMMLTVALPSQVSDDYSLECALEIDLATELISSMELVQRPISPLSELGRDRLVYFGLGQAITIARPSPEECLPELPPLSGRITRVDIELDPPSFEHSFRIEDTTAIWNAAEELEGLAVGDRVLISGFWVVKELLANKQISHPLSISTLLRADGGVLFDPRSDPDSEEFEGPDEIEGETSTERDELGRVIDEVMCEAIFLGSRSLPDTVKVDIALEDGSHYNQVVIDWWQPTPAVGDRVIMNRDWTPIRLPIFHSITRPDGTFLVHSMFWLQT